MAFRDGGAAVSATQGYFDAIERDCIRVIGEIDAGSIRLGDLNTGLRELCESAVITLADAKATSGFADTAATIMGAAYDAVAQADAVLAAIQPVRTYLKANWPLAGGVPRTVKWQDADPNSAEVAMDVTGAGEAAFHSGLRPLAVTLRDACSAANDNAGGKVNAQAEAARTRAVR